MTFDFLHTVDWIVPQPVATAQRFNDLFGLPAVADDWVQDLPSHGYEAVFSRVGANLTSAPTRLEFIAPRPVIGAGSACSVAPLDVVARWQAGRPQQSHANVVCAGDFEATVEAIRANGIPVWVEDGCEHLPHNRAWIGWTSDGGTYVPGYDAGLLLEMIPTVALGRRVNASVDDPPAMSVPRVGARWHLVADLDSALRLLAKIGLEPAAGVSVDAEIGGRVATYSFRHPASAQLKLVQPVGDGWAGSVYELWGEGPLLTSLLVDDLDAHAGRAVAMGATVELSAAGAAAVVRDPLLGGIIVQLSKND